MEKYFNHLPEKLREQAQNQWQNFASACKKNAFALPTDLKIIKAIITVFASSQYVTESFCQQPRLFFDLLHSNDLQKKYKETTYGQLLADLLKAVTEESQLISVLREFRRREMVRIAWRDLLHLASLKETMTDLTNFADSCVRETSSLLQIWQSESYETYDRNLLVKNRLVVVAAGKLGAKELNFSSDIDLIFCFDKRHYRNKTINQEHFFTLLGQRLIKVLNNITYQGLVFRVDMRLRPFGSSGPLVVSISALADYYREQGRDWERYAMAKARVISGNKLAAKKVETILHDFVYRYYVDYTAIESLRQLKKKIIKETQDLGHDIKRGRGGIREIEFIVQVFQLIRGGHEPALRQTSQLLLMTVLLEKKYLAKNIIDELFKAYQFFRMIEHRLQEYADQQTQQLPSDEQRQLRLAFSMGYKDWESFEIQLQKYREKVAYHFELMVSEPKPKVHGLCLSATTKQFTLLLEGRLTEENAVMFLEGLGFKDAKSCYKEWQAFADSYAYRSMETHAKAQLQQLLPLLIPQVTKVENAIETLIHIINLLETIARRSIYLTLLLENQNALAHLVELFSESAWISENIIRYPFLLGEFIDCETLCAPLSMMKLANELQQYLLAIPEDDLEEQMKCLRRFKWVQILRVAVADIKGMLPTMKVSDHLTYTANIIIQYARNIAWHYLVARHGYPTHQGQSLERNDFAIIGYGKLGGIELSYGSDLDIVFLRPDINTAESTDGPRPISNSEFYVRLAQRIINILSTSTVTGILYAVDTRLRPSGSSGLLVSSLKGYADYQCNDAWTWEHQALVRARIVCGSLEFSEKFTAIRTNVLSQQRNNKTLKAEIVAMRERMRETPRGRNMNINFHRAIFDLDQGKGGIKDIEFIVQYIVLNWGHRFPSLYKYTDNVRIIAAAEKAALLTHKQAVQLWYAYCKYRQTMHHLLLKKQPAWVDEDAFKQTRHEVIEIWNALLTLDP